MSRFNDRNKFLDYVFKNEEIFSEKWEVFFLETYKTAKEKKFKIYEVARRRFRKKEFYIYSCVMMGISPATYYRLLNIFFRIAENKMGKFFQIRENENRIEIEVI